MRDPSQARYFNETHKNPKYLSDFELPANVRCNVILKSMRLY